MEITKLRSKAPEILFLAFLGLLLILGISFALTSEAKSLYKPLAPAAQSNYDAWAKQNCPLEKTLAQAKLMDVANGVKVDGDLNVLNQKANRNCDEKGF